MPRIMKEPDEAQDIRPYDFFAGFRIERTVKAEEPDEEIEIKVVRLDRPFLYMIIDQKTKTPVFIGTVMEMPSDVQ